MDQDQSCPRCGKPLPANAPAGLCPECLLKAGVATTAAPARRSRPRRKQFEAPEPAELAPLFPQLEVVELIGQGGMGAVYRARQPSLDRTVALKIIPAQADDVAGFASRFAREARALAQLNHPNIVAVHDFGRAGAFHYFVMEFVDGLNLRQVLNADRIAPREALAIVPQICEALQYAHDRGVVHRDIKPENILLAKSGAVKIADFGLAKVMAVDGGDPGITGEGDIMGTPHYMAPEQLERPLEVDHRADIFSVGVVFYQMLTGELPLGRFAEPSKKVQVDVRIDEIVLRALEKEPNLRFQQAGAMRTEVETVASGPAHAHARPAPGWSSLVAWRAGAAVLAVACVLLIAYLVANREVRLAVPSDQLFAEAATERVPTRPPSAEAPRISALAPEIPPAAFPAIEARVENRPRPLEPRAASSGVRPGSGTLASELGMTPDRPIEVAPIVSRAVPLPARLNLPDDFEAMEANPEILKVLLVAAESEHAEMEERYRVGVVTQREFRNAAGRVGMIKARLAGDRVAFAQVQLDAANRGLEEATIRKHAGLVTEREYLEAKTLADIAAIRMSDARGRSQREQTETGK